jgi:GLPGLI family protein
MKSYKCFILILFSLVPRLFFAQNGIVVTYEENQFGNTNIMRLTSNGEKSIYKMTDRKEREQFPGQSKKNILNMEKNAIYLVKLFKENKILYPAIRVFDKKKEIISDSLNSIKWKIMAYIPSTKYLGRKVKMAKCRFRERNYTAFYCPDIPISDGPFKFNGLPGLILKIETDDHMFSFSATKIEFVDNPQITIAPKYFSNHVPFWTYVKLAKKEMAENYKQFLSTLPPDQRNTKFDVKIDRIEMVF